MKLIIIQESNLLIPEIPIYECLGYTGFIPFRKDSIRIGVKSYKITWRELDISADTITLWVKELEQ